MSLNTGTKFYHRTDVKLTFWYIFTFFLSVLLIFGFLYFRLKHQLIKEVDRILYDEANELSGLLVQDLKGMDVLRRFENTVGRTYYPICFSSKKMVRYLRFKKLQGNGYKLTDTVISSYSKAAFGEVRPRRRKSFRILASAYPGKAAQLRRSGRHTLVC
jgi:hypothetical protein